MWTIFAYKIHYTNVGTYINKSYLKIFQTCAFDNNDFHDIFSSEKKKGTT